MKLSLRIRYILLTIYDFSTHFVSKLVDDKTYILWQYKRRLGFECNIDKPVTFGEKMQWLKLFWRDDLAKKCSDKLSVRTFVEDKVGKEVLNELYSVHSSVDDISIETLPNEFIIKTTHGSGRGYYSICKDKSKYMWDVESMKLKRSMRKNYFWKFREWVYKDIKPRLIIEKLLIDHASSSLPRDFKFHCFNGEPRYCQVISDRDFEYKVDFFDMNWELMNFVGPRKGVKNSMKPVEKPKDLLKMLEICQILSSNFPYARIDLYYVNDVIYFGEITFFPLAGYGDFSPTCWNAKLGNLIDLSRVKKAQI